MAQMTLEQKKAVQLLHRAKLAAKDTWTFLKYFVYTHDEHDKENPVKAFPTHKIMYRVIIRFFEEYQITFLEKSRQIMLTWLEAALTLHDSLFFKHRRHAVKAREDKSSTGILKRIEFIYGQLIDRGFPELPQPKIIKGRIGTDEKLEIPKNHSIIHSVPKGSDVLRSWTFSRIFLDEMAHQDDFEEAYGAGVPTTQGEGKLSAVGTANGREASFRKMYGIDDRTMKQVGKKLVDSYDVKKKRYTEEQLLRMKRREFYSIPLEEIVACIPGMRFWIMTRDEEETACMQVHYSADPDKRPGTPEGDLWLAREKKKLPKAMWEREMEINHDTFMTRPVIGNWDSEIFVDRKNRIEFMPDRMLEISVDFGTEVCGAFFGQRNRMENFNFQQAWLLDEIVLRGSNTIALAEAIVERIKTHYREAWEDGNFIIYPDPSGNAKSPTTADKSRNTSIKILNTKGLRTRSKKFGVADSTQVVEAIFHMTSPAGDPAILIHPRCSYMISCLSGGWRYPDKPVGQGDGKPEKDGEYDHGGDMIRYLLNNMFDADILVGRKHEAPETRVQRVRDPVTGSLIGYRTIKNTGMLTRGIHPVHGQGRVNAGSN